MGAKAWFIAYYEAEPKKVLATKPAFDRNATEALVRQLFPHNQVVAHRDGELPYLNPDEGEVIAGCYPGLSIVAHIDLADDFPSKIDPRWLNRSLGRSIYLHAMVSVADWFAFGYWRDGQLIRSLSLAPDHGVIEQIGAPLPFEAPFWAGQHTPQIDPGEQPYPLPFHPLELAEASMLEHFGFQFEGEIAKWLLQQPEDVRIARFVLK